MHGRFGQSNRNDHGIYRRWGFGFLALPLILLTALLVLSILQPPTANWIADAVQAEFTGAVLTPEQALPAQMPVQLARPTPQTRFVRVD
jgi:hypothetical protein